MKNFAETESPKRGKILAATKEIFSSLDKKLSNIKTGVEERIEIFKKIQGTNAAKQSQYLKALSKIPGKYGQAAKAIILGTAGAATIATIASAGTTLEKGITTEEMKKRKEGTLEPGDEKKETSVLPSVVQEHPILSGVAATVAPAVAKKAWEGAKWVAKKLTPIMTPGGSTLLHGGPQNYDLTSGGDLSTMAFWKHATDWMGARSRWGNKQISLIKRLRDIGLRGGLPTRFLPLISGATSVAAGPMLIKDAAAWLQGRIDKEGLTGIIEDQAGYDDPMSAGASVLMEDVRKEKKRRDAEGMDYAKGGIAGLIIKG